MGNRYLGTGLTPELIEIVRNKAKSLIARKYFTSDDFDDLQQELFIALWQGLEAYELGGKIIDNKEALAQHIVSMKVENLIDKEKAQKRKSNTAVISLNDTIDINDNYPLIDNLEENYTFHEEHKTVFVDQIEHEIDINTIINKLPQDLQELYALLQIMNISEIAKLKKASRKTIYKKINLIKRKFSNFI